MGVGRRTYINVYLSRIIAIQIFEDEDLKKALIDRLKGFLVSDSQKDNDTSTMPSSKFASTRGLCVGYKTSLTAFSDKREWDRGEARGGQRDQYMHVWRHYLLIGKPTAILLSHLRLSELAEVTNREPISIRGPISSLLSLSRDPSLTLSVFSGTLRSNYNGWGRRMLHRKWNNRANKQKWLEHSVQLVIPFPVRHSASPPSIWRSYDLFLNLSFSENMFSQTRNMVMVKLPDRGSMFRG